MARMPIAVLLACLLAAPGPAVAEDWPSHPLTVVVPFAAGGPIDVVGRLISPRMSELLGQQLVIDNVPGAGGMVGASRVAKSAPDGYTMLIGNQATHIYSQFLYQKPLYDPLTDFAPGGLLLSNYKVLVVRKDLPVNTLPEFVAYAKAHAAQLQYGSGGGGSATHTACLLLNAHMGTQITHVPYRGTGPAMQDVMAGRVDFLCDVVSTALPQIRAGTVKAIAMLSNTRAAVLPELPTALEQGLAGVDADGWNALFFPKGTPAAIIERVNAAAGEMLDTPAVHARIEALGLFAAPAAERSPEYLAKLVVRELDKWGPPIKASGVTPK
ncbi:MAG TPA: tripartite tricarboxylate transporter substrate binding protein [Xanthobacteraceae bacterium]